MHDLPYNPARFEAMWTRAHERLPKGDIAEIFESALEAAYRAVLSPGDVAIDAGAHRARHTLPMAECVGPAGRVYAVEASAFMQKKLENTINDSGLAHARKTIQVLPLAASDRTGWTTFYFAPKAMGMSSLKVRHNMTEMALEEETVELAPLDQKIKPTEKLRFFKLDVEGAEYHALRGSERLINFGRPLIGFESGGAGAGDAFGYSREDFFGFFDSIGYALYSVLGFPYNRTRWGRSEPWYIFAIPRERGDLYFGAVMPAVIGSLFDAIPDAAKA